MSHERFQNIENMIQQLKDRVQQLEAKADANNTRKVVPVTWRLPGESIEAYIERDKRFRASEAAKQAVCNDLTALEEMLNSEPTGD